MSDNENPVRPPTSGPGSSVVAWRTYASAVTGSPLESWEALSREEIVERLDSDGVSPSEAEPGEIVTAQAEHGIPAGPGRPGLAEWMVPTDDGLVPESELSRRR